MNLIYPKKEREKVIESDKLKEILTTKIEINEIETKEEKWIHGARKKSRGGWIRTLGKTIRHRFLLSKMYTSLNLLLLLRASQRN